MKVFTMTTAAAVLLAGCEKSADSFSILSDSASFTQNTTFSQRPIDILWVIDNSGSMANSQQNLANSFQSFINRFQQLDLDFRMGVITTDAYLAYHYNQPSRSRLKDRGRDHKGTSNCGDDTDLTTGVRVITPGTPDIANVFIKNIKQGICGNGDERAFSSMEHALSNTQNNDFRRPNAFLSVIIVSDEDDFSHMDWQNGTNSYFMTENYNHASMFPISRFTNFLDELTDTIPGSGVRNYSVSAISINSASCLSQLAENGQKIAVRYPQLVAATNGTLGSLCDNFGETLELISEQVIANSSVFKLGREPYEPSIRVVVNGGIVPHDATNGWTYDADTWTISFHGAAIPPAGADVKIYFDPVSVQL